jgi:hypothetical protein
MLANKTPVRECNLEITVEGSFHCTNESCDCRKEVEDSEDDEGIPRKYPRYPGRVRFLNDTLPVYVRLPGAPVWRAHLFNGLFSVQDVCEDVNEWHLLNAYKKRFKVKGTSSVTGLQAIYVESGIGRGQSLASLLLEKTDEELAQVGSSPSLASIKEDLEAKAATHMKALDRAKWLVSLETHVKRLESEVRDQRNWEPSDEDPSTWPAEILECKALEERIVNFHTVQARIKELRLFLNSI